MLERLYIEATDKTPRAVLDKENKKFMLSGRSLPEDAENFYRPIITWLEQYALLPEKETPFEINLDYYNSSTLKKIVDILVILRELHSNEKSVVTIVWYYEDGDDSAYENGEDLCFAAGLPIELRVVS